MNSIVLSISDRDQLQFLIDKMSISDLRRLIPLNDQLQQSTIKLWSRGQCIRELLECGRIGSSLG